MQRHFRVSGIVYALSSSELELQKTLPESLTIFFWGDNFVAEVDIPHEIRIATGYFPERFTWCEVQMENNTEGEYHTVER